MKKYFLYSILINLSIFTIKIHTSQIYFNNTDLGIGSSCRTSDNVPGTCTDVMNCPYRRIKLDVESICYFVQSTPIVCCINEINNLIQEVININNDDRKFDEIKDIKTNTNKSCDNINCSENDDESDAPFDIRFSNETQNGFPNTIHSNKPV